MSTQESLIPAEATNLIGTEQARAAGIVEKKQFQRSDRFVLVTWLASYRNSDGELVAEARSSMIARP